MRKTTNQEQEVLEFLNILRDSGDTKKAFAMRLYAGDNKYIEDEFDLDSKESKRLLMLWMENFNDEGKYDEVKE